MPSVSKAQQASVNKYIKNKYDRIIITASKQDGVKQRIQAAAKAQSESVNGFILQAVDERIERLQTVEKKQSKEKPG